MVALDVDAGHRPVLDRLTRADPKLNHRTRATALEAAMRGVASRYLEDTEATILYAHAYDYVVYALMQLAQDRAAVSPGGLTLSRGRTGTRRRRLAWRWAVGRGPTPPGC